MKRKFVRTSSGIVMGSKTTDGCRFVSIPYCITERFKEPKDIKWHLIFNATKKAKNAAQRFGFASRKDFENDFYYQEFYYHRDSDFVESPMTMSITTPLNAKKCPVIVFFHGGSFENGIIDEVPFGENYGFAKDGIIFVSVGYRLNVFGMYGHKNYGLKDQVFAIKWLKKNIIKFGGDPNHLVLMGQSAGALYVSDLLMCKQIDGLIKGAIMISGCGFVPKTIGPLAYNDKKVKHYWKKVMEEAGCEKKSELKKIDAEKLFWAWYKVRKSVSNPGLTTPGIDGKYIYESPYKIMKENQDIDVPILFGITSQDMMPYAILDCALTLVKHRNKDKQSKSYGYFFDHTPPGNKYKAYHSSDLWYVFGDMHKSWRKFEEFDYQLSDIMHKYIRNFVFNLNPNSDDLKPWPAIGEKDKEYLRLFSSRKTSLISTGLARQKLYRTFIKDKGPL